MTSKEKSPAIPGTHAIFTLKDLLLLSVDKALSDRGIQDPKAFRTENEVNFSSHYDPKIGAASIYIVSVIPRPQVEVEER